MRALFAYTFIIALLAIQACSAPKKTPVSKPPKPPIDTPPAPDTDGGGIPVASKGIAWKQSEFLMPVLEEAQKANKPVFIEFTASWCAPCKVMEREVFSDPVVYEYLNKNFLSFRVDVDAPNGKPVAEIYEVAGMPTVVFVDPKGVELERELGLITGKRFLRVADGALAKMK
jgi:thiol:disulfide interchange protein